MQITTVLRVSIVPALFLGFVGSSCRDYAPSNSPAISTIFPAKLPPKNTVFTSSSEVMALTAPTGKNEVWAATTGGVLRINGAKSQKWTRAEQLPSNEAFGVRIVNPRDYKAAESGVPLVQTPLGEAYLPAGQSARWIKPNAKTAASIQQWHSKKIRFDLENLYLNDISVGFPIASQGTHIAAVAAETNAIRVAVYGDGFWLYDGRTWKQDKANVLPANAREITALAPRRIGNELVYGTRRDGIWRGAGKKWRQITDHQGEPYIANTQFFAEFKGALFASTLDDGLVYLSGDQWKHVQVPTLSSNAARHLEVFGGQLFVRYGTGVVDSFDGATWTKDALKTIPRKGVYALDAEENRLICAGWGGFSEWDGQNWTAHFDLPEIKGVPLVGIQGDGENIWLLTQSRGLMKWSRAENKITIFDERNGLSDDWITAVARSGDELYAGTFVGGLCHYDGKQWVPYTETKGENITALEPIEGGVLATSRSGLWRVKDGAIERVDQSWIEPELQAVFKMKDGVWLGGRTSMNFWKP